MLKKRWRKGVRSCLDPKSKKKIIPSAILFECSMLISEKPKKSCNTFLPSSLIPFLFLPVKCFLFLCSCVTRGKRLKKGVYKNIKCHCGDLE